MPYQEFFVPCPELRPVGDGKGAHAFGGGVPDSPESFNGKCRDEFFRPGWMDREQPVRLTIIRSNLCQEFIVGNAGGGRQVKFPSDFLLNPPRNVDGQRNARLVFRDVQKGFIQGKGFHQICVTVENGVYLRGDGLVHIHAVAGENQMGAKLESFHGRHGGTHSETARLITGRRHHAAHFRPAYGDGLAAVFGMIPLFYGCVKGIHIHMDDFSLVHGSAS